MGSRPTRRRNTTSSDDHDQAFTGLDRHRSTIRSIEFCTAPRNNSAHALREHGTAGGILGARRENPCGLGEDWLCRSDGLFREQGPLSHQRPSIGGCWMHGSRVTTAISATEDERMRRSRTTFDCGSEGRTERDPPCDAEASWHHRNLDRLAAAGAKRRTTGPAQLPGRSRFTQLRGIGRRSVLGAGRRRFLPGTDPLHWRDRVPINGVSGVEFEPGTKSRRGCPIGEPSERGYRFKRRICHEHASL